MKFLRLAGCNRVQSDLGFRRIGRPHPGFDAIKGRVLLLGPSDDAKILVWTMRHAAVENEAVARGRFSHTKNITLQTGVDKIDEVLVRESFPGVDARPIDQSSLVVAC